jgi:hypothetical protein
MRPSDLVTRCNPLPVLAFEGGGCASMPTALIGLALAYLARRRARSR